VHELSTQAFDSSGSLESCYWLMCINEVVLSNFSLNYFFRLPQRYMKLRIMKCGPGTLKGTEKVGSHAS